MSKQLKIVLCLLAVSVSSDASSQTIALIKNMDFGDWVVGVAATAVLAPTDAGAAVFNVSGMTPGRTVVCSIRTPPITISNGGTGSANRMTVSSFTISGCTSVVPPTGVINNIGVGATATIASNDNEGLYNNTNYGQTVRFRLVTY